MTSSAPLDPYAATPTEVERADLAGRIPLAINEMSFLLPRFLDGGRGRLEVYFTRVYNPVWTNPRRLQVIGGCANSWAIATRRTRASPAL